MKKYLIIVLVLIVGIGFSGLIFSTPLLAKQKAENTRFHKDVTINDYIGRWVSLEGYKVYLDIENADDGVKVTEFSPSGVMRNGRAEFTCKPSYYSNNLNCTGSYEHTVDCSQSYGLEECRGHEGKTVILSHEDGIKAELELYKDKDSLYHASVLFKGEALYYAMKDSSFWGTFNAKKQLKNDYEDMVLIESYGYGKDFDKFGYYLFIKDKHYVNN